MADAAVPWHWAVAGAAITGGACWLGYRRIYNKVAVPPRLAADITRDANNVMAQLDAALSGDRLLPSQSSRDAVCAMGDYLSMLKLLSKHKLGLQPSLMDLEKKICMALGRQLFSGGHAFGGGSDAGGGGGGGGGGDAVVVVGSDDRPAAIHFPSLTTWEYM
jgi:hypothetical protein